MLTDFIKFQLSLTTLEDMRGYFTQSSDSWISINNNAYENKRKPIRAKFLSA